ncbi:hypothetical protein RVY68_06580 [Phocaeicola vulgatus]|uniref:Uncharacterized protein n=1 Tax=Phocaeicola vulgatus TaxID=821 RepID=A0AAE4LC80_PHOVU|nr:hypothetical protein [Phocaeicola vulgatus]MDU0248360.1 hypothetical protein [Phocaeicola vulgatus]
MDNTADILLDNIMRVMSGEYFGQTKAAAIVGGKKKLVNPEKPDVPLNKNDAFQKVQKRRVQEKR